MKLPYCISIGFIRDFECDLDCDLDIESGEAVVVINDVSVRGNSLLRNADRLMADIGFRIASLAEDDDWVMERLVEDEGIYFTGRGAHDPDGRLRRYV